MQPVRADLHCHSTASQLAKLGVQRALALPECATEPEEVYELAKRRGMDFVTITDHDTISGALAISGRDDVFISVELTARFKGEPQAVHVLCWDITPADHEWLQAHAGDVVQCAEYLEDRGIACALAHPFFSVAAPLTAAHRRRLARLFPVWETRNGSRARELNQPAAIYIETHGGVGVGGSDDHAGVDIGRTWTATPPAATPADFLAHVRAGRCEARGDQGSAAKWTHAALAIAVRTLGTGDADGAAPDPWRVLQLVERFMRDADERGGAAGTDLGPDDARAILRAYLDAVGLDRPAAQVIAELQREDFRHADLFRRASRVHERRLDAAVDRVLGAVTRGDGYLEAALGAFGAALPALPYAPSIAFLGREKAKLAQRDGDLPRVALVADGVGSMHGVTHTLDELRERGVPGFEVEVVGTDPHVDRRLPSVRDVDVPFYPGLQVGVPSLPAIVEALADGRYDLLHVCSPGPAGIAANLIGHMTGLPVLGSYHTELAAYAGLRSHDPRLEAGMRAALGAFYGRCDVVLSPSEASDDVLRELGIAPARVGRWDRGVDTEVFRPELREPGRFGAPGDIAVLYAGRLTREKGADLLADAFLAARERDPRLHLVLAGGGPEELTLRERLGAHATFLGWLAGGELARAYASADVFLFASRTDTFGQVLLEAQASGLAVVAVDEGGPRGIVRDGRTGVLCAPRAEVLAGALLELAGRPLLRERLAAGALAEVRERTWARSLERLADGYARALEARAPQERLEALA
jgi:glycosyltransferase involved in cell wall biosynthesis/predicted metal-dependent phosphoesterase TrpH